jgi:2-polyprenyl-3-methyl-5-hydroxy-6-metoxy-1,4-benzoquinol methylase
MKKGFQKARPTQPEICSYCGGPSQVLLRTPDRNRKISKEEFIYLKCRDCDLTFLQNVPPDLGVFYGKDYYALPTLKRLKAIASSEKYKIATIQKFSDGKRLLEIGPAFGVFAYQAKSAGFDVTGIEMDERCCQFLNTEVGIRAVNSPRPTEAMALLEEQDVIAMWHVIEHLPNPFEVFDSAAHKLNRGGILVVATPNPESLQFKIQGAAWPHIDAPRHLYLIPSLLLVSHAKKQGLQLISKTTSDADALRWNTFGWQRILMNQVKQKNLQRLAYVAGYLVSQIFRPFESRGDQGSAYTLVFRKDSL